MRGTAAPVLLALALLTGVAGCGSPSSDGTDPATSSPPTTQTSEPSPSTPEASGPPFPADTRADDGGQGSGNGLGVTGVRVARQDGFDRVVFDLDGTGTPGWRVEYTAEPTSEGSGEPVAIEGEVFLQVVLRGVGMPFETGIEPFGDADTRVPGTGTTGVAEVAPGAVYEGEQQAFIGLTGTQRPFRVFALTDPVRVVVDVRDE